MVSHRSQSDISAQSQRQIPPPPPPISVSAMASPRVTTQQSKPVFWKSPKRLGLTILLGLLPLMALGMGGYVMVNRSIALQVAEDQAQQASQMADRLNQFFANRYRQLDGIARLPMFQNAKWRKMTPEVEKVQALEQQKQSYGVDRTIALFDLEGNPLVQTAGEPLGNQAHQSYFKEALAQGRATMSEPLVVPELNLTSLRFAQPVRDEQTGQIVGVLVADMPLSHVTKLLPQGDTFEVVDGTGQIILSSQPSELQQSINAAIAKSLERPNPGESTPYVSERLALGLSHFQQNQTPRVLGIATPVRLAGVPSLNWSMIRQANPETVRQTQQGQLGLWGLGLVGFAGLMVGTAVATAKRAAKDVENTVEGLEHRYEGIKGQQQRGKEKYQMLDRIIEMMRSSNEEEIILNTIVTELRYALKTDRVVVYRFEDDWTGQVIAESVNLPWKKILHEVVNDGIKEGLVEHYCNGRVQVTDGNRAGLTRAHNQILDGFQIRASIGAPILRNGKLIGLLCAHECKGPRHWEPEEIDLFAKLSSQLGFVLDQAALIQRQSRGIARSQLLNEIVDNMRRSLKEEDILNVTVSELRYALNTDRVIVYRFHDDWNGTIIAESGSLTCKKILGQKVVDPFREGMIDLYRNGRVRKMNDIYAEGLADCHRELLENFDIRASIVAPILRDGELMGLLCAHECETPRQWENEDVDLFGKLATQLGFALDQAIALRQQTLNADRSRLLTEIVSAIRRSLKEEDILNTAVSELRYALRTDRVIVYRFDADWNGTVIAESVALGWEKFLGKVVNDPFRERLIERYRNGRVRTMHDVNTEELAECHRELLDSFQIRASIVAPILQNGELIGLLCAHECKDARQWEPGDSDFFGKMAAQLGFALDQAETMQKQIRSAQQSKLLSEIVGNMRRSMTQDAVLNTTVSELRYALKTDRVIVYRFHNDWNGTIVAESVSADCQKTLGEVVIDPFREGLIDRYKNGRVRWMNDILAENLTQCHQELLENFQIRASIVAPILQNGSLIGLLCAHECQGPRVWELEDIELFKQLAIQLGFALDQVYLLETTEQARRDARSDADAQAVEARRDREVLQTRIQELLSEVNPARDGDLTVKARVTPDQVGTIANSYNTILDSLRQIVMQVQQTSQSMSNQALTHESAVAHLSLDSRHQVETMQQALVKIQQMVESIAGVAQRAMAAEQQVQIATKTLTEGDVAMDRTVLGMSRIRETVAETTKKVKRLGEVAQRMTQSVYLIDRVTQQTNVIAMNASIEAARAGEDSRGLGVLADEVRNLAEQSSDATDEMTRVIAEIQNQTNDVVRAMEMGAEQVAIGTELVEESRFQLGEISEVGSHLMKLVKEISAAAAQQQQVSSEVSETITEVAQISEETSKQTEIVSESFSQLMRVTQDLQVSTSQFKVK
jgi:methyl-accepting chemotaxis protein PixJ